jgi:MinD-like ATPase involved in chromosome partitioning or flagellar assembly
VLDHGQDQAAGLRRLVAAAPLALLAFPLDGGPGAWIAQLAHALRGLGRKPVVLDAGRGTVAAAFGLKLRHELLDLLQGGRDFNSVAQSTADGVYVLRGDRGIDAFVASGAPAQQLLGGFARLAQRFDDLLLAMPAGELACLAAPGRTVPVIGLDATSAGRVDSYALVKHMATGFGYRRYACVVRNAHDADHAKSEHARLAHAAREFLGADVQLAGWLPAAGDGGRQAALARTADTLLQTAALPLATA